jgi:hypothetical protein
MNEITDEQRDAWLWLQTNAPGNSEVIAPLLPSDLTNPQPVLPTEPGVYEDKDGDIWRKWDKQSEGMDRLVDGFTPSGNPNAWRYAPFTRLVPGRPQIAQYQVEGTLRASGVSYESQARAILDLVNGTDRD